MIRALFLAVCFLALAAPVSAQDKSPDPLFTDMGGKAGIDGLVDMFVDIYLADPRVKDVFSQSNMERVRAKMKEQFCVVAGGPCTYTGHAMEITHRGLHLTEADFNAIVEDLQKAMDRRGISFFIQNRFLARLAPMEHEIVTR